MARPMENSWGTLKFNLFYLCGVVLMDIYCMIFNCQADVTYLNLSLFLSYATMYPEAQFLVMFIIPIKAWILALVDLALVLSGLLFSSFPYNLFSVISVANYFLFFGADVLNVVPISWRANFRRLFKKKPHTAKGPTVIPFPKAGSVSSAKTVRQLPLRRHSASRRETILFFIFLTSRKFALSSLYM